MVYAPTPPGLGESFALPKIYSPVEQTYVSLAPLELDLIFPY